MLWDALLAEVSFVGSWRRESQKHLVPLCMDADDAEGEFSHVIKKKRSPDKTKQWLTKHIYLYTSVGF